MNRLLEYAAANAAFAPDKEAYRFCWRKEGEWQSATRAEFQAQTAVAAKALAAMGLIDKDTIAICSPNTPQILMTEYGAFQNRIACIPIYNSSSQAQYDQICSVGKPKVLFVGDKHQYPLAYNYWRSHPRQISRIVVYKNDGLRLEPDDNISIFWDDFIRLGMEAPQSIADVVAARSAAGLPEDVATLIFTSGTTGEPKGVCITHANYDACMEMHLKLLGRIRPSDISMAFLPMSHILEKAWCYFCITKGVPIAVNYDPRVIQDTIKEVEPNLMCCVPRFWEKVYAGVREKIASMSWLQRRMVARALKIGKRRNLGYVRLGRRVPFLLEKEYNFWDRNIFGKLKKAVGIPDPNFFPTAGAPLSDRICEFMRSVGIDVVIGYGLSETTATVTCFRDIDYEIGTVGLPLPGISVRISEEGEILVKGATVTPGYYQNPEANAQAFTSDGYFRTGDAGYLTPSGALVLTERVKDLFKTSNGKYIAPQAIESRLGEDKYIEQVAVIGDKRKYVTAIIIPAYEALKEYARKKHIKYRDIEELIKNSDIRKMLQERIDRLQESFAGFERIKKFTLLSQAFTMEAGELTNTLKIRRPVINSRYAREIEAMYV